jgi:hypothetical protein
LCCLFTHNPFLYSGQIEEEEGWIPGQGGAESEELEEIEEDEDIEDQIVTHMREVSEVRFPGEVGPLGDHRLCKIKCVKGKWIGPLCAISDQEGLYFCYR